MSENLSIEQKIYFLHRLRAARYKTLENAEDFTTICFCLEELGCALKGAKCNGLGGYQETFSSFVSDHQKADFEALFYLVKNARNDFSHQGVFARRISSRAVRLGLMLEESLMPKIITAAYMMSDNVVQALDFHSLSKIRELMLENSYSYLPYQKDGEYYLVSDAYVAELWNGAGKKIKYETPIKNVLKVERLIRPKQLDASASDQDLYKNLDTTPVLIFEGEGSEKRLVGILAPFDLL